MQGIKVTHLKCPQCSTPNPEAPPPPEPEPEPEPPPKRKFWNRKGEEIEPPPPTLNEKQKMLLKKFLQLKLNNAWQGWKGWCMDNKRYPGLVRCSLPIVVHLHMSRGLSVVC